MNKPKEIYHNKQSRVADIQAPAGFKILKLIGQKKESKVYLALHEATQKEVALKLIPFFNEQSSQKFIIKMGNMASLRHSNIVSVHEVGFFNNLVYFVMDYIEGTSLENQKLDLNEEQIWSITLQICQALQEALKKNIIHGNLKPSNLLLNHENKAKLSDIGLAKTLNDSHNSFARDTRWFRSTHYINPELAVLTNMDFRSDIYSLGTTIYYLLTKEPLFSGKSAFEVINKQRNYPPHSPREVVSTISQKSCLILAKMLHKNPKKRYQSYGDLIIDISAFKENKDLSYANEGDHMKTYFKTTARLDVRLLRKNKTSPHTTLKSDKIIMISSPQKIFLKCPRMFHFAESFLELRCYLKEKVHPVLLDSCYLEEKTLSFVSFLKEEFPLCPLWILSNNTSFDMLKDIPLRSYQDWERKIVLEKETHTFQAHQINLKSTINLINSSQWSGNLNLFSKGSLCGKIVISKGRLVQVYYKGREGTSLLSLIIKEKHEWRFVRQETIKIEKQIQKNRIIVEELKPYNNQRSKHVKKTQKKPRIPRQARPKKITKEFPTFSNRQQNKNESLNQKDTTKSKTTSKEKVLGTPAEIQKAEIQKTEILSPKSIFPQKEDKSILSGDLSTISLLKILQTLSQRKKTGCLSVVNKKKASLYIEEGFIVDYQSSEEDDKLHDILSENVGYFIFEPTKIKQKKFQLSIEAMIQTSHVHNESSSDKQT